MVPNARVGSGKVYPRIDYRTITGVEAVLGDKGAVLGDKGVLEWELTSSFKMFSDFHGDIHGGTSSTLILWIYVGILLFDTFGCCV